MAKIIKIDKFTQRKKKWEHFKLKIRSTVLKLSILMNFICLIYIKPEWLTNIIDKLTPILESLITKLPL